MMIGNVRIIPRSDKKLDYDIYIDDVKIDHGIRKISFCIDAADKMPRMVIEFVMRPDIPENIKAVIETYLYDPLKQAEDNND
jgi:hypothetical protein